VFTNFACLAKCGIMLKLCLQSGLLCLLASSFCQGADLRLDKDPIASFFAAHCEDCHANGASEGGFRLEELKADLAAPRHFARWERIFDRTSRGEMPPPDADSVPSNQLKPFLATVAVALNEAHKAEKGTVLRRLNRREYENTMNDLFGTRVEMANLLPEDGLSHEFDNVGAALGMSMVHLRQYLAAADAVIDAATAKTANRPPEKTITASYAETREGEKFIGQLWKKLPDGAVVFFTRLGYPTGMLRGTEVQPPGRYRIRVTGYAYQSDEPITFRLGGTSFLRGARKLTYDYGELPPGKPTTVKFTVTIPERYMVEIDPWGIDTGNYNLRKQGAEGYTGPGLAIQKVELTGPLLESYPSRGHQLLYADFERNAVNIKHWQREHNFELKSDNPVRAARTTLERIANHAFRRPVRPGELDRYIKLFESELAAGADLEPALRTAVAALFCSPDFLYLNEPEGRLDDHALATRLAYFLTRTAPDAELRQAADAGKLTDHPEELLAQTRRLLNDPRHERFLTDFCDAWLNLRDIEFTSPDQQLFPEFDQYLQFSMLAETREFVGKLIRENLPVVNVVRSDFAMLNERLAEHYELSAVDGPDIRPVRIPADSPRGGLLSQASVLKVSANGTNTSPVVRGVWVLERILGQPPQPPPPGIPGIEPDIRGATTLRDLLARHRDLDSCRGCHAKIDPPGFAMECFNPIGGYRDRFRSLGEGERVSRQVAGRNVRYRLGPAVDASGELPDGTRFSGFLEYRDQLADDPRTLAQSLTTKLMIFATGREMGFSDRPIIANILAKTEANDYRVRDLIEQIVLSDVFLNK